MINLNSLIVPGKSAANVELGVNIDIVLKNNDPLNIEEFSSCIRYDFNSVKLWVKEKYVSQIGVEFGYSGKIKNKIGIGSTLSEAQEYLGEIIEDDEDNLVVKNMTGFCFATEPWFSFDIIEDNPNAKIVGIYVYGDYN